MSPPGWWRPLVTPLFCANNSTGLNCVQYSVTVSGQDQTGQTGSDSFDPSDWITDGLLLLLDWQNLHAFRCGSKKSTAWAVQTGPFTVRLCDAAELDFPRVNLSMYVGRAFAYAGPTSWNSLPYKLKNVTLSLQTFKRHLKTSFFLILEHSARLRFFL